MFLLIDKKEREKNQKTLIETVFDSKHLWYHSNLNIS